jgi:hypothetical protein
MTEYLNKKQKAALSLIELTHNLYVVILARKCGGNI